MHSDLIHQTYGILLLKVKGRSILCHIQVVLLVKHEPQTHPAGHSAVVISSQSPCTHELSPPEGRKQQTERLACVSSVFFL